MLSDPGCFLTLWMSFLLLPPPTVTTPYATHPLRQTHAEFSLTIQVSDPESGGQRTVWVSEAFCLIETFGYLKSQRDLHSLPDCRKHGVLSKGADSPATEFQKQQPETPALEVRLGLLGGSHVFPSPLTLGLARFVPKGAD